MCKTNFIAENRVMVITRTFTYDILPVWKAWTNSELIDQWWAPKPWKCTTREMEFREGGTRLYTMENIDKERHNCETRYKEIKTHKYFRGEDYFCDSAGNIDLRLPVTKFENFFYSDTLSTSLVIITEYERKEDIDHMIKLGIEEGLSKAFDNLDMLLSRLKS